MDCSRYYSLIVILVLRTKFAVLKAIAFTNTFPLSRGIKGGMKLNLIKRVHAPILRLSSNTRAVDYYKSCISRVADVIRYSVSQQKIHFVAERRAGEMLKEEDIRQKPGEYKKLHDVTFYPKPSLEELGITKIQSHRWQLEGDK